MSLLGSELVTDSSFDDASKWTVTTGGSIVGGAYNSSAASSTARQTISIISGRTYQVSYIISTNTDACYVILGGTTGAVQTGTGTITANIVAGATGVLIVSAEFAIIDSISVKEISVATKIHTALNDLLILDSTVSAQVLRRVYPQIIPQNTSFPAIRYNQISGVRDHNLTDTANMVPARFQIDCYGSSYSNARTIADAVRGVLDNYHGTVGSVVIQCTHLIDEGDYFNETVGVDQLRRYGKTQDYMIWYNE